MRAFDSAWGLLKMPIGPGSLRFVEPHDHDDKDTRRFEALFKDPQTDDEHRMNALYRDRKLFGAILEAAFEGDKSWADFRGDDRDGGFLGDYSSVNTITNPPYRRRGYATALYDMAAAILAE